MQLTLEADERKLHASIDPGVERIVHSKSILLFKRMLQDIQYDDMEVVDILVNGVSLTGDLPDLGD